MGPFFPQTWLLVAGSTTPRALPRRAAQQQVRGGAGDCVVIEKVGGIVEGAGAGDLADQAPPHAGSWARGGRVAQLEIQNCPGLALQGVEVEAGLASSSPDPGPCVEELSYLPVVNVVVVVVHGVQDH